MDNKQQKSKKRSTQFRQTDRRSLIVGSFIATFIALTPYFSYLYESVPDIQVWDTFLFTYDAGYWESANYAMWTLTSKLLPLLLLIIWFFTCRHWWYHALLVPIAMYIYQVVGFFNVTVKYLDEFQLLHLVPVMAVVVPSIYLIRARMFDKINTANKSLEELEEEFKIKPQSFWEKVKQYF
jgi:uncharacterized membrane protein (DUF485 family)